MAVESSSSTLPRPKFARLRPAPRRSRSASDLSQCRRDPAGAGALYGTSCCSPRASWAHKSAPSPALPHPLQHRRAARGSTLHPEARDTEFAQQSCVSLVGCLNPVCLERKARLEFTSWNETFTGDVFLTVAGREIMRNVLLCRQSWIYRLGKRFLNYLTDHFYCCDYFSCAIATSKWISNIKGYLYLFIYGWSAIDKKYVLSFVLVQEPTNIFPGMPALFYFLAFDTLPLGVSQYCYVLSLLCCE